MLDKGDPEDAKIVTLARSAHARTSAAEGAAVRDLAPSAYVLRADPSGAVIQKYSVETLTPETSS